MRSREELEAEHLALLEAEDYARAEVDLGHFIRGAWKVLEPGTPYLHNWHIDAIADHLNGVFIGQIRKLIINMPPRNLKSISATVCFPAWVWIRRPEWRILSASFSARLSTKHNMDRRTLIESDWYQRAWGSRFKLSGDLNMKTQFSNDHRGLMYATSVGGSVMGEGGDCILSDDPVDAKLAASDLTREKANDWRDKSFSTRLNDKKKGVEIIIMQRLHEKDLTGHVLEKKDNPEEWVTLRLEGVATKKHTIVFPVSGRKIMREEGDLLHPERENARVHAQLKIDLGEAQYQAQYQQDPKPMAGGFFKPAWWRYYDPQAIPKDITEIYQFWDCAEEPGITNDWSVCATWGRSSSGFYLLDLWRRKVAFPELQAACINLYGKWKPSAVVVEKKSAGTQLIQNVSAQTTLPVLKYNPRVSKTVRAAAAQPTVQAGNCYLPKGLPWVADFITEHELFPNSDNDDQVDTTGMMVHYFVTGFSSPSVS